ncbi:MAG: hypothetical protein O3A31_09425 [Planctomycetota bacterium]|nr:hypothetical protein [Planctomycetota bacterium]
MRFDLAILVDVLKRTERSFVKETIDRPLDIDQSAVQRAGGARAADPASEGAIVGGFLILEDLINVENDNFTGVFGKGEAAAWSRDTRDDSSLRQVCEDLRQEWPLEST